MGARKRIISPSRSGTVEDAGQETRAYDTSGFETLMAAIARRLLGEPLEFFDSAVTDALSRLIQILDVDRSTFGVVGPDAILRTTLAVAAAGLAPFPVGRSIEETSPWVLEQLTEKRVPVVVSSLSDLPSEAAVDGETFRAFGVKSVAVFPIVAGDRLLGGFSFGTTLNERLWPQPLVDRLRLIGEVFAGALLRRDQEGKLRETLTELEALRERLQLENDYLRQRTLTTEGFEDIVGESAALRSVLFQIEQVAPTDATVLLLGETGTGKELIARAIHARSARRDSTVVSVNCAALSPALIESELFGHEKGAFTGAVSRKIGRFELATGSTLFLDEIGEIPFGLQAKLLRVLQEGEFERLGSSTTHKVDVRVIAASNRDLSAAIHEGSFRPDLYYRLGVFPIRVPPLRSRKEDIPVLVWHFLGQLSSMLGKRIERVPAPAMDLGGARAPARGSHRRHADRSCRDYGHREHPDARRRGAGLHPARARSLRLARPRPEQRGEAARAQCEHALFADEEARDPAVDRDPPGRQLDPGFASSLTQTGSVNYLATRPSRTTPEA